LYLASLLIHDLSMMRSIGFQIISFRIECNHKTYQKLKTRQWQ